MIYRWSADQPFKPNGIQRRSARLRVDEIETGFGRFCGSPHAIGVGSGTDTLAIILRALEIGSGDEVLVPAASAAPTAMAVTAVGARPVFVDVSSSDFTADVGAAETRRTARTRAVIEDASQAHGSDAPWGRCGTFGVAAAFSFYPTKNLGAYGDGGMIVTRDRELARKVRLLRNYDQRDSYVSETPGVNSRLDELQAALLRVKLIRMESWNRRRRDIAAIYRKGLEDLPVALQGETGSSNCHLFVAVTDRRDELRPFLASRDIPTRIHYPLALNQQNAFRSFDPQPCPNAERLCANVFSLPMHAHIRTADAHHVVRSVRDFFEQTSSRSNSWMEERQLPPILRTRKSGSALRPRPEVSGLPIPRPMPPVVIHRLPQSVFKRHTGSPACRCLELGPVGIHVADVDGPALFGKGNEAIGAATGNVRQQLGDRFQ